MNSRLILLSSLLSLQVLSLNFAPIFARAEPHGSVGCQIILIPGALGAEPTWLSRHLFLKREDYFLEYSNFFESQGCRVRRAEMPSFAGIQERAGVLRTLIEDLYLNRGWDRSIGVTLIGHSQAGLDARFLIAQQESDRAGTETSRSDLGIRALITLSTPHQGSLAARAFLERRGLLLSGLGPILDWLGYSREHVDFLRALTPDFLALRGAAFEKSEHVRYASAVTVCRMNCGWQMRLSARVLGLSSESDGIIEVSSQGFGDDLGVYDLDHLSAIDRSERGRDERQRLQRRIISWIGNRSPN